MDRSRKRWLIGWSAVVVLLGLWLLLADKPWGAIADDIAARQDAGKQLKTQHYATVALWWTGLASWIALLISGLGIRWWAAPLSKVERGIKFEAKPGRLVWGGLIVIVTLGAAMRLPLAGRSLWWDELWNAKLTIVGYYLGEPDEPLADRYYGAANFERAMWLYSKPTNHAVASVPAHLSHRLLSDVIDSDRLPHEFRDITVRLPTLLVSLGCIALVGVLGIRFGGPVTGLVAAFLLAVQPWHVRFGLEIRSYSWVLLWTLLGVWCLTKIFRQGRSARWRYWFLLGLIQALIVWSFPYAATLAGGFFIGAVALILHTWSDWGNRIIAFRRLVLVNVMAAFLFVHFFGPNLLQMREWYDTVTDNHENHPLNAFWFSELLHELVIGFRPAQAVTGWVAIGFAMVSAVWGAVVLWKSPKTRPLCFVIGSVLAGTAVSLLYFKVSGSFFYPRFVSFALVPVILLVAIGWSAVRSNVVLPILGCTAMLIVAEPRLRELLLYPLEPLRDVADFLESRDGEIIPVGYGHSTEYLNVYLPSARSPITGLSAVDAAISEAREKSRPLYVIVGRPNFNRATLPEGFTRLDDPAIFEEIAAYRGIEPDFTYRVLQLKNDPTGSDR